MPFLPTTTTGALYSATSSNALLRKLGHKALLERLAGGETVAYTSREFNARVDDIYVGVGLDIPRKPWETDWERGCGCMYQAHKPRELVSGSAPRMLISELGGVDEVMTAMLEMCTRLNGDTAGKLDGLKRETLERLRVSLALETRVIKASETVAMRSSSHRVFCRSSSGSSPSET
ncbi:hypothetical protein ON010_g12367 [Phytophthora cinnamomi]|nr:hypothetical protein ON010_g12367 [Phytophthora cinnamomi]